MNFSKSQEQESVPAHQAVEDLPKLLVILHHLLGELPPLLGAATHQPLLHQSPDVLHHHQPLGLLLQTL